MVDRYPVAPRLRQDPIRLYISQLVFPTAFTVLYREAHGSVHLPVASSATLRQAKPTANEMNAKVLLRPDLELWSLDYCSETAELQMNSDKDCWPASAMKSQVALLISTQQSRSGHCGFRTPAIAESRIPLAALAVEPTTATSSAWRCTPILANTLFN